MKGVTPSGATKQDLAWAAGLFEGEGCFTLKSGRPCCELTSTDKDVVMKFRDIVSIGSIRFIDKSMKENRKDAWAWNTSGYPSSQYIIALFWTFLGKRRRKRAEEILAKGKEIPGRRKQFCKKGHRMVEGNIKDVTSMTGKKYRECIECRKARK